MSEYFRKNEENITCLKCGVTRAKEMFNNHPLDFCRLCVEFGLDRVLKIIDDSDKI